MQHRHNSQAAIRHTPTLYSHTEDDGGEIVEDDQWPTTIRHSPSTSIPTPQNPPRPKYKHKSNVSHPSTFSPPPGSVSSGPDAPSVPPGNTPVYSDIYSKFVQRFRHTDTTDGDPRDDPDSYYFQRGLGQLVDGGDSEDDELASSRVVSGPGIDIHEHFSPTPEPESLDAVTPQERERLEWQIMLASVLDGDVLKSEKTRIAVALDASVEQNRQLDIWLGIRARLRRRSESEERRRLTERRLRTVDPIVTEILAFRFQSEPDIDSASGSASATHLVGGLLKGLDIAQSLYPSLKAMYTDKPTTTEDNFQARCDALIAWYNIDKRLRFQLSILRKWTGSDSLDVTQPNTTAEVPIGTHPHRGPVSSPNGTTDHADASTFVERVLKEVSLQEAFERGSLTTLHTLISQSRATLINHAAVFRQMNLPGFEKELVQIASFPSRLMEASIHVRLDYASKVKDPEVLIIDQLLEDFKVSIGLACTVKKEYQWLLAPVPESNWQLPPCIPVTYDDAILNALRFFFKLIHWKLKSGTKGIYFKETDVLEAQTNVFAEVSAATEEGSLLVAEQLCSLTNRLMIRVTDYFETQLHVPSIKRRLRGDQLLKGLDCPPDAENSVHRDGTTVPGLGVGSKEMTDEQIVGWFSKVLDSVRLRYRKMQRYVRVLTQRFSNSAEYSLEGVNLDMFISALVATDHFLVYTECFEEEGTYVVASPSLRDRPDSIRHMLRKAYHAKSDAGTSSTPGIATGARTKDVEDVEDLSEEEDRVGYLLLLSPTEQFLWHGLVLMLETPMIDLDLKDKRIRLVADGGHDRLVEAKQAFTGLFYVDNLAETPPLLGKLRCVTEQQAHLPSVNRELRKIVRATNRLAEAIVNSVHHVRGALTGINKCQELLENWFSFASEHGQHVQKHMDRATWIRFNRLLTRLAISWVAFICDDCDPTDRKTFRWAVMALEFTLLRTRHNNILHLPEDQFGLLRQKVASCMTLLISHFDILGARSSYEAKKERERQEELQRQQALEASKDDDDQWLPSGSEEGKPGKGPQFIANRSVRLFWEDAIRALRELESRRTGVEAGQRLIGRVLDNEKPEDRSLVFLASSSSNISIRWQQGRFIGAGAFGSVYLAVNLDSGSLMAVKEIRYQDVSSLPNLYTQIREELQVMEMLHHPNVVEYYGIEVHRDKIYIFEEYCQGGSLSALLELGRIEDEGIIQVYTMQMLEGLAYLHSKGIVHRDIKPDNILLDHMGVIKFVDFGAAKILAKNQRTIQRSRVGQTNIPGMPPGMANNSLTGTPMYMSPEVIKNDKRGRHGAMDIWSLGCVVLEFATGRKPWSNLDNEWAIMFHIGVATQHPPLPESDQLSELGINFIKQCLTIDPMRRPTAVELMDHPWMVMFREALEDYQEEANMDVKPPSEPDFEGASVARQAALMHDQEVADMASSPTLSDVDATSFDHPIHHSAPPLPTQEAH